MKAGRKLDRTGRSLFSAVYTWSRRVVDLEGFVTLVQCCFVVFHIWIGGPMATRNE